MLFPPSSDGIYVARFSSLCLLSSSSLPHCFIYVCTRAFSRRSSSIRANLCWEWEKSLRLSEGDDGFGFGFGLKFSMINISTSLDMTDKIIWFCSALLINKFPFDCSTQLHLADASLSTCHQSCMPLSYRQQRTLKFTPQWACRGKKRHIISAFEEDDN